MLTFANRLLWDSFLDLPLASGLIDASPLAEPNKEEVAKSIFSWGCTEGEKKNAEKI